jgi:hypothetical protein
MGPRAVLNAVEKRKISFHVGNRPPAVQPIARRYIGLQSLSLRIAPDNEASQQRNIWNSRRNKEKRKLNYDSPSSKS